MDRLPRAGERIRFVPDRDYVWQVEIVQGSLFEARPISPVARLAYGNAVVLMNSDPQIWELVETPFEQLVRETLEECRKC